MRNHYYDVMTSLQHYLISWSRSNLSDFSGITFPQNTSLVTYRQDQDRLFSFRQNSWQQLPHDHYYFDFDQHAEKVGYPDNSFVGLMNVACDVTDGFFRFAAMIAISVSDNTTLDNHHRKLGELLSAFYPKQTIPIRDFTNNQSLINANATVVDAELFPVLKSEVRTLQNIGVNIICDLHTNIS